MHLDFIKTGKKSVIELLDPLNEKHVLRIAEWYAAEWDTPFDRTYERLRNQKGNQIIFQLVLLKGDILISTGGVYYDVNIIKKHPKFSEYGPWLGLIYTDLPYRGMGFGKLLLNNIEREAFVRNIKTLYLSTFTAQNLYQKNGWKVIDQVTYKGHLTKIMKKELNSDILH